MPASSSLLSLLTNPFANNFYLLLPMLIQELSSYLAYYPIAQELTECAEEQAVLHEQTYRKVTRNQ
jgi:hypothetical protein